MIFISGYHNKLNSQSCDSTSKCKILHRVPFRNFRKLDLLKGIKILREMNQKSDTNFPKL